jgi:hypothetical protein
MMGAAVDWNWDIICLLEAHTFFWIRRQKAITHSLIDASRRYTRSFSCWAGMIDKKRSINVLLANGYCFLTFVDTALNCVRQCA